MRARALSLSLSLNLIPRILQAVPLFQTSFGNPDHLSHRLLSNSAFPEFTRRCGENETGLVRRRPVPYTCNPINAHLPNASRNARFQAASRTRGNEDHRRVGSRGRYKASTRHDTTRHDRKDKRVRNVHTVRLKR